MAGTLSIRKDQQPEDPKLELFPESVTQANRNSLENREGRTCLGHFLDSATGPIRSGPRPRWGGLGAPRTRVEGARRLPAPKGFMGSDKIGKESQMSLDIPDACFRLYTVILYNCIQE